MSNLTVDNNERREQEVLGHLRECHNLSQLRPHPRETSCNDVAVTQFPPLMQLLLLQCWPSSKDRAVLRRTCWTARGCLGRENRLVPASRFCSHNKRRHQQTSDLSSNESPVTQLQSPVSTAVNLWGSSARRATIREVHADEARESKHKDRRAKR